MSTDTAIILVQLTIATAPQPIQTSASLSLNIAVIDLDATIQAAPITDHGVLQLHQVPVNIGPHANDLASQALLQHPVHPAADIITDIATVSPARTGHTKNMSVGHHHFLNA